MLIICFFISSLAGVRAGSLFYMNVAVVYVLVSFVQVSILA